MSAPAHFPLPVEFDEITPEWLTAALRIRQPGATISKVEIVDMVRGTTTKIRLRVERDEAAKAAGIPKLMILKGGFEPHSRSVGMNQMFRREVRAYRDVFPAFPLPTPTCYFADYDADRKQGIVLMEDLVERGVEFCHATRPQTPEQVRKRLSALAKFHAGSWATPELGPGGKWDDMVDFFDTMRSFFEHYVSPEVWARFVASPRGAASSVRFHDHAWVLDGWERVTRYAHTKPHCILHGDIHLGNLFIYPDGTPGFFDSITSRGPGMLEVSYHISASVDTSDRAAHEGPLVQHYLDELKRHGADAPSFEEAMHQYKVFLLYGYFIWMTTEADRQTESVNTANIARVSNAMLDHDFLSLIKTLP